MYKEYMDEVVWELKNLKIDILALTETKKKDRWSEKFGQYNHFYSGVAEEKRVQQVVSIPWEKIDERLIKINLSIQVHKQTIIIGVYAVNDYVVL